MKPGSLKSLHILLAACLIFVFGGAAPAFADVAKAPARTPIKVSATKVSPVSPKARRAAPPALKPTGAVNVYLIRGFLGVFSLGMDRLNRQLAANRIPTKIFGHLAWRGMVNEIVAEAARHPKGGFPVVIVGHSFGANAALMLANTLGEKGVPVDLVITVDPTVSGPTTPAVRRYLNIYQANNGFGVALKGKPVKGEKLENDNARDNAALRAQGVTHFSMDENAIVQKQMFDAILKTVRR